MICNYFENNQFLNTTEKSIENDFVENNCMATKIIVHMGA